MSFSNEWDSRYQQGTHLSIWPWSDLVGYVNRFTNIRDIDQSAALEVLEIGCGAGANIPFFNRPNVRYHAVEGSPSIVDLLHNRFPHLASQILVGDFTKNIPFDRAFDLIIDRSSMTHNDTAAIIKGVELIHSHLKPEGVFMGFDWFSTKHTEFSAPVEKIDHYTRRGFNAGPFAETGNVHFSDAAHLKDLFKKFKIKLLEHKETMTLLPETNYNFAAFNLVASI